MPRIRAARALRLDHSAAVLIIPAADFDWSRVAWRRGRDAGPLQCAVCDKPIEAREIATGGAMVLLVEGWKAEVCAECVQQWFRIREVPAGS